MKCFILISFDADRARSYSFGYLFFESWFSKFLFINKSYLASFPFYVMWATSGPKGGAHIVLITTSSGRVTVTQSICHMRKTTKTLAREVKSLAHAQLNWTAVCLGAHKMSEAMNLQVLVVILETGLRILHKNDFLTAVGWWIVEWTA